MFGPCRVIRVRHLTFRRVPQFRCELPRRPGIAAAGQEGPRAVVSEDPARARTREARPQVHVKTPDAAVESRREAVAAPASLLLDIQEPPEPPRLEDLEMDMRWSTTVAAREDRADAVAALVVGTKDSRIAHRAITLRVLAIVIGVINEHLSPTHDRPVLFAHRSGHLE